MTRLLELARGEELELAWLRREMVLELARWGIGVRLRWREVEWCRIRREMELA